MILQKLPFLAIAFLLSINICAAQSPVPAEYVPDEIIVHTRQPVAWDKVHQTAEFISLFPAGSRVTGCADIPVLSELQSMEQVRQGIYYGTTFLVKLPAPDAVHWVEQSEALRRISVIENVWYNEIGHLTSSAPLPMNDPSFNSSQYQIKYDQVAIANGVLYTGWQHANGYVFKNTAKVIVAVLDGGMNMSHQDIQGQWLVNTNEPIDNIDNDMNGLVDDRNGWDYVNNDNIPNDDYSIGHGTHVGGIIAAKNNNGNNTCGIITDSGSLLVIKVADANGNATGFSTASGYNYALSKGARVINMSFTFTSSPPALMNAIAIGISTYKTVPVAGSGNTGNLYYGFPASGPNVLTVGNANVGGVRNSFSSYSDSLKIMGPGTSIISLSSTNNAGTNVLSGTS